MSIGVRINLSALKNYNSTIEAIDEKAAKYFTQELSRLGLKSYLKGYIKWML